MVLTAALALAVVMGGRAAAGELKIGFVDLQRALNECDAGKGARERFLGEMEAKQARLRKEKEALDNKREEFDKKAMVLREKERQSMEQQLEDQGLAFKRKYEDYQKELKRMDSEYTGSILRDLEAVIGTVGSDGGYTVIFEMQNSGIIYGDPSADLTDEIIRRYNASGSKK
jgi:outer membrane protein